MKNVCGVKKLIIVKYEDLDVIMVLRKIKKK